MSDSVIMYEIVGETFVMLTGILIAIRYKYRSQRQTKVFLTDKSNINWMTRKSKTT